MVTDAHLAVMDRTSPTSKSDDFLEAEIKGLKGSVSPEISIMVLRASVFCLEELLGQTLLPAGSGVKCIGQKVADLGN